MLSTNFCKREVCPSSAELLEFIDGDLTHKRREAIDDHLPVCEFCSAEIDLYSHFPLEDNSEPVEATSIPAPLAQLAEALLKKRNTGLLSLDGLLKKIEVVSENN
jgi:hypothetical protein